MSFNKYKALVSSIIFAVLTALAWFLFFPAPKNFPLGDVIKIENGTNVAEVAKQLRSMGIVKTAWPLSFILKISRKERDIKSGYYLFDKPLSAFGVAKRLTQGDFNVKMAKITVPEGSTLKDIAEIFSLFENFNKDDFLTATKNLEGYLFPDTYFLPVYSTTGEVIKVMRSNFESKVKNVSPEIIVMASLIEKEAADERDRRIISGILWKRLNMEMPLQVDAVFYYLLGKKSFELTSADMKVDSPYNTYLHKGLPPYPICNPGLNAIEAALNPLDSAYLYYLSDGEGGTHYAVNLDEHKKNKRKYLLN